MRGNDHGTLESLDFEAYGVTVAVRATPELADDVREILPPGARPSRPATRAAETIEITAHPDGQYEVMRGELRVVRAPDRILAIAVLDTEIRRVVASNVTTSVFIHAGVVAVDGRVLVLPGESFAGKSTLVRTLIARSAAYFSDEYAVIDEQGLVHPYAKPLYLRRGRPNPAAEYLTVERVDAAATGATVGTTPLPIGAIVVTRYEPNAKWAPEHRTPAQGALALFSHATTAEADPARVLRTVRRAAENAVVREGVRGDAEAAADELLSLLSR